MQLRGCPAVNRKPVPEHLNALLDEALQLTFPPSDPIAIVVAPRDEGAVGSYSTGSTSSLTAMPASSGAGAG